MKIYKGYRIKIYPNKEQKDLLYNYANVCRYVYNWGIDTISNYYKVNNTNLSKFSLVSEFRKFKSDNIWLYDVNDATLIQTLFDVFNAFTNYIKHGSGYPKYKKKKNIRFNIPVRSDRVKLDGNIVKLSSLGKMRCGHTNINRLDKKYYNTRLYFDGIDYWLSISQLITLDAKNNITNNSNLKLGLDLGIKNLVTCSNGIIFKCVDTTRKEVRLLKLRNKVFKLYKRMRDKSIITKSNNLKKLEYKLNKLYIKIRNIIHNNIHYITNSIIKMKPSVIVLEDLDIDGMKKKRGLSKYLTKSALYMLRTQLEYKCKWHNIKVIIADRFYASSQLCSSCGNKKLNLSLSDRVYKCEFCGLEIDRDLNAALNLQKLAL